MAALSVAAMVLAVFTAVLGLGLIGGVFWVLWKALRLVFRLIGRALGLVRREAVDGIHAVGALVTACATLPLMAVNFAILRLASARHYGRAFVDELKGVGVGVWRVALGNPLRFVGLGRLVDVVESRLPDIVERAPRSRRARRATFDGYEVVGTLPSGGSGAQLFIARPKKATQQRFARAGRFLPPEVVIKSFALESGSTLPQIVRESRALEAASRLGLVCEHQLSNDHFYYTMPYVKGEDLDRVTRALHARGSAEGLADPELRLALGYGVDLLDHLQRFHTGGLWHKDVKPSNILVAKGRAHLVDFGLVTPLASAMTLTTHGTEYYRDPEMVRLAMQGVKVHQVDGARFDVYSAGAVLYSLLENSFPAHGSLSRLSKRAPDALRWIVQRAMADLGSRYASASEMRADLVALLEARDPFAVLPAELPSFRRALDPEAAAPVFEPVAPIAPAPSVTPPRPEPSHYAPPTAVPTRRRGRFGPALAAAAAGVLGLMTVAAGTAAFAVRAHRHSEPRLVITESSPRQERAVRAWSSLDERERRIVSLAEDVAADLDGTPEPAVDEDAVEVVPVADPEVPAEVLPAQGVLPPRGRVLVLDDVTTGVSSRTLAVLRTRLAEGGYAVVGLETEGDAALRAVELLATARNAAGLGRADEAETQTRLQRFLDAEEGLDALILVSKAEAEEEHLYRVFVRGVARPAEPR